MRVLRITVASVALLGAVMAGCTAGPTPSGPEAATSTAATTVSAAPDASGPRPRATVFTEGNSQAGCDADLAIQPGNCWLPLYAQPSYDSTAYNLGQAADGRSCQVPPPGQPSEAQRDCWPQPGTVLELVCGRTAAGPDGRDELWLGVLVPAEQVLTGGAGRAVTGFNRAPFFSPVEDRVNLPDCGI